MISHRVRVLTLDPVAAGTVSISTEVIGFNDSWPASAVSVTP